MNSVEAFRLQVLNTHYSIISMDLFLKKDAAVNVL